MAWRHGATRIAAMLETLALGAALAAPPAQTAQLLLETLQAQSGQPGLGAAVWQQGRVAWQGQAGLASRQPPRALKAEDRFPLASVSKLVTATLAARLQAQGRLDLDAPLARLLPGEIPAAWAAITPRQLAAHSSGMPHYQLRDSLRGGTAYASVQQAVREAIGERALLQAPGTAYVYSSWGYTLLSRVVEQAAGRPFLTLAREEAGFGTEASTELQAHDYSYSWAGAGLAASPAELVRWGGRLLAEPALLARMAEPTRLQDGREILSDGYRVGIGWRLQDALDGEPLMHHAGARPDARTALALWPASGMASALLANGSWTSFIVGSAELLAAPFRPLPAGLAPLPCPLRATQLQLQLVDERADLPLPPPRQQDGICRADLPPGPLRAVLPGAGPLQLIGLDGVGGLARAALVAPTGLIELRAQADGSLLGRYGQRALRLRFLTPQAAATGAPAG